MAEPAEIIEESQETTSEIVEEKPKTLLYKSDAVQAFNNFLYLESLEPNHTNRDYERLKMPTFVGKPTIRTDITLIELANKLAASDPSAVIRMSKKAIQSNLLPTNESYLWFLAQFMKEIRNENVSKEIRENFLELVQTPADLIFFLKHLYSKLSFSASMKKCLTKWYDQRSPSELLEIIFASPKSEHGRHIDVIRLLHPKFDNEDKNEIVKASFMSYKEIQEGAKQSTTLKKILKYKDLKKSQKPHEVASILKRKDFVYKLNHLPSFALKHAEIVELILPNLSLADLIGSLTALWENNLLQPEIPISRKICNSLKASNKIVKESKLNALYVFEVLKTLERYNKHPRKKVNECCIKASGPPPNTFVNAKLMSIINLLLGERGKTGCRYYVTLDLRKFSKQQSTVAGMKNVLCSEAQIICALQLLKTEKDVTLMTFTEDRTDLKPVLWNAKTTYEQAMEYYKKEEKKTKESIILPLKKAELDKKPVDVFITFVSSVRRSMGRNPSPPFEQLKAYRENMKLPKAKYIVVNLTRVTHLKFAQLILEHTTPDFKYDEKTIDETGFLEIAGFSPESLKVMDAFAKNCFD